MITTPINQLAITDISAKLSSLAADMESLEEQLERASAPTEFEQVTLGDIQRMAGSYDHIETTTRDLANELDFIITKIDNTFIRTASGT